MMNDRFASQLRRHLIESADERAADGQLAAVIAAVGATGQRRPLAVRLAGMPGRVGPIPASAFRFALVALALALAAMGAALLGAGGPVPRSTSFEGTWAVVDPADGSTMKLYVLAGQSPGVRFEDLYATGAACQRDRVKVFTADGTGRIEGSRMLVEFPNGGGCGLDTAPIRGLYDYDESTDALTDADGLVWHRVDQEPVIPVATPRPIDQGPVATDPAGTEPPVATVPPATDAPPSVPPDDACLDLSNGGTYAAPTGELILIATVPGDPKIAWRGDTTRFELGGNCDFGLPITIYAATSGAFTVDRCMPINSKVSSFADAINLLDRPSGPDISPRIDLTIDGHPAARYDISNLQSCESFGLWDGTLLGQGESGSVYVIDVDGVLIEIELNRHGDLTDAQMEEAWGIVASLRFDRGGG